MITRAIALGVLPDSPEDRVSIRVVHQDHCQANVVLELYGPGPYPSLSGYDLPGDFCDCRPTILWYSQSTPLGHMNFLVDKSSSTRGEI